MPLRNSEIKTTTAKLMFSVLPLCTSKCAVSSSVLTIDSLWEIALRKSPWPELKFGSQFAERYQNRERPEIPIDNPFKEVIEKCWNHNPADRPAFYPPSENGVYPLLQQLQKDIGAKAPSNGRGKSFTVNNGKRDTSPSTARSQSTASLRASGDLPMKSKSLIIHHREDTY